MTNIESWLQMFRAVLSARTREDRIRFLSLCRIARQGVRVERELAKN